MVNVSSQELFDNEGKEHCLSENISSSQFESDFLEQSFTVSNIDLNIQEADSVIRDTLDIIEKNNGILHDKSILPGLDI